MGSPKVFAGQLLIIMVIHMGKRAVQEERLCVSTNVHSFWADISLPTTPPFNLPQL